MSGEMKHSGNTSAWPRWILPYRSRPSARYRFPSLTAGAPISVQVFTSGVVCRYHTCPVWVSSTNTVLFGAAPHRMRWPSHPSMSDPDAKHSPSPHPGVLGAAGAPRYDSVLSSCELRWTVFAPGF